MKFQIIKKIPRNSTTENLLGLNRPRLSKLGLAEDKAVWQHFRG